MTDRPHLAWQIFIQSNVSDGEQTVLDSLTIFGNTKETTDMKNLKKVG